MIIFSELQMQGNKHVHVNSGLLKIIIESFGEQEVNVFCDDKHKNELLKYVTIKGNIHFSTFVYAGEKELRKSASLSKFLRESILAFKIFKIAKKKNCELIVFASAFPFTALSLSFFSKIFCQKIIICLHGDIGVLSLKRNKPTTVFFRLVIKMFFKTRGLNTIALFYGKPIENKFFEMFPQFEKRNIISIDHPYNYDSNKNEFEDRIFSGITIANIGVGIMNKNSHLLYKLALLQRNNIINKKNKFIQIGNVSPEVLSYSNEYVEVVNNNTFISFDVFEKNIKKADYFVYFFTEDSIYDLCPSGTFFDALKYQKPIISLHNPFFDFYFEKLGNIGYLCDSVEEMSDIINEIVLGGNEEYFEKVKALALATQVLSISNIQKSFIKQYNTIK